MYGRRGTSENMKTEKQIRAYESVRLRARELRREMTSAEKILWEHLRDHRLGDFKFRRQAPTGHFITDFYCPKCKLVVEIDGDIHDLQIEQDKLRTEEMENFGYRVIRFRNEQAEREIESVLNSILDACRLPSPRIGTCARKGRRAGDEGNPPLPKSGEGSGVRAGNNANQTPR